MTSCDSRVIPSCVQSTPTTLTPFVVSLGATLLLGVLQTLCVGATIDPGDIISAQFNNSGTILVVDPATGDREILSQWPSIGAGPRMRSPYSIAALPDGDFLAVESFTTQGLFRIDSTSGDRTFISGLGGDGAGEPSNRGTGLIDAVRSVHLTPGGEIFLVNQAGGNMTGGGFITRVDPVTGNRMLVSGQGAGAGPVFDAPQTGALDADGQLIVADYSQRAIFEVDLTTGARSILSDASHGTGPVFGQVRDLAILPSGDIVAIAETSIGASTYSLFGVDPATGNRSVIAANTPVYQALSLGNDGWMLGSFNSIVRIDPANGAETLVSGQSRGTGPAMTTWGDMVQIPVPEPSTLAMLLAALPLGYLAYRRSR